MSYQYTIGIKTASGKSTRISVKLDGVPDPNVSPEEDIGTPFWE